MSCRILLASRHNAMTGLTATVRRLWAGLLLVCLLSNIASAQILARPEPDNQDPVRCFDHVYRDARNAAQAYQIVYAPGWREEVACHGKIPAPDLEACWPPVLQARPLIERAAQLYEQARRTPAPQQGQLVAQGNALIREAAGLLEQAGKCFQPIFARWQQNGGRYVAANPNAGTGGDVFSSNSNPGGRPGDTFSSNSGMGGLPGEPRIDEFGVDTECGGTNRRYYDQMYGTKAVVISVQEMKQLYSQGRIIRCGACKQNVICWLKPSPTAGPAPQPKQPPGPTPPQPKPPAREPTPNRICTLRDLAALVFERYGSGSPIATVRIANRPNTYLLLLQGMDDQEVQLKDAVQGYLRNAGSPELRLIENLMRLANGDPYQQGVIDAVNQLPPGATLMSTL